MNMIRSYPIEIVYNHCNQFCPRFANLPTEVLGFQRKNYKGQTIENNPIIEQLSRIQKEYRIKIGNSSNIKEVKKLRNIRNQTPKRIKNEIRKNNEKEIEDIAKIIPNDNQSTAMFKAVKQIKKPNCRRQYNSSQ